MKKILPVVIVLVFILGLFNGCSSKTSKSSNSIKIGCEIIETGDTALTGTYMKNGIELAVEQANNSGGALGRQIEPVYEDDLGTDTGAVNAYNKLAGSGMVAAIGSFASTQDLAISASVSKAQIPTMVSGSNNKISALNNAWLFQGRTPDALSATVIVKYAVQTLNLKKLALIYDTDAFGAGAAASAETELKALNITPVVISSYNAGDKDYTAIFSKIKQAGADGILAWSQHIEAGLIMKQKQSLGLNIPLIGSNSYSAKIALDLAGSAANNVYAVADYVPTTTSKVGQAFAKAYKAKYGIDSEFDSAIGYDEMSLLINAIKTGKSADPTAIKNALASTKNYQGALTVFTFNEQHVGGTGAMIVQVVNGVPQVLQSVSAR
jgi:branched-chain amino acid transport system substrate-binding protein